MKRDSFLRLLFKELASPQSSMAACKMRASDNQMYYVSRVGVLQGAPLEDEQSLEPDTMLPVTDEAHKLCLSATVNFGIAVWLDDAKFPITFTRGNAMYATLAKPHKSAPRILEMDWGENTRVVNEIPYGEITYASQVWKNRVFGFPDYLQEVMKREGYEDLSEFSPYLTLSRARRPDSPPLLVLEGETCKAAFALATCCTSLGRAAGMTGETYYSFTGFDESNDTYTNIRENKMAKLVTDSKPVASQVTPIVVQEPAPVAAPAAPAAPAVPVPPPVQASAPVPQPPPPPASVHVPTAPAVPQTPVVPVADHVAQPAVAVVEPEPVDETGVEIDNPKVEPTKEAGTQQRTRKVKQATAVGFDYSKVLEYVGAPVDISAASSEKIIDELRNLRDLQIASARRCFNLATAALEAYMADSAKYQELKKMFGK